jgi:hypothetical protein
VLPSVMAKCSDKRMSHDVSCVAINLSNSRSINSFSRADGGDV